MILQLNQPIRLVTPHGKGLAMFMLDYGCSVDTLWGVFIQETGEFWWEPNKYIRYDRNYSMGYEK